MTNVHKDSEHSVDLGVTLGLLLFSLSRFSRDVFNRYALSGVDGNALRQSRKLRRVKYADEVVMNIELQGIVALQFSINPEWLKNGVGRMYTEDWFNIMHSIDSNSTQNDIDLFCEIEKLSDESKQELMEHIKYLKLKQDGLLEAKIINNTAATYMKDGKIISKIHDALNLINEDLVKKTKKTELSDKIKFKLPNKKRK